MTAFKFYHGTSTIFLESIKNTGLGAINPNIDFKNLEVLKYLFFEAEKYLSDSPDYREIRLTTNAMVNQGSIEYKDSQGDIQRLHFRHGGIYVSLSESRAVVYATNKYGSEIILRCVTLYELLRLKIPDFTIPEKINLLRIDILKSLDPKPIIIELINIDDEDLAKEDGKTAKEALDFVRAIVPTLREEEKFKFLQYCNFELLKPAPPEKLKFYNLAFTGHPASKDFRYYLREFVE